MPHTFTETTIIREVMTNKLIAPHYKLVMIASHNIITYHNSYTDEWTLIKYLQGTFLIFSKESVDMAMDIIHILRQLFTFSKIYKLAAAVHRSLSHITAISQFIVLELFFLLKLTDTFFVIMKFIIVAVALLAIATVSSLQFLTWLLELDYNSKNCFYF